ncbi:manganese efflux pump [bacterium]|nr:manganese efflux pump [bacterium]
MSLAEIIFLALVLATDAFSVSFSYGLCNIKESKKACLFLALGTGFFQFMMPLIGAFLTNIIFDYIQIYAQFIAGIIFILIGLRMIFEAKNNQKSPCSDNEYINITFKAVLLVSVATSIDALASGGSLFLMKAPVYKAALIIGVVTFLLSVTGFLTGKFFKKIAPDIICKFAGAILVFLGIKSIFL